MKYNKKILILISSVIDFYIFSSFLSLLFLFYFFIFLPFFFSGYYIERLSS